MDPISSLLVGHAAGKLLDKFGSSFRTHVIERWSRRRAEEFFGQFCEEVSRLGDCATSRELDETLARMVEDEVCSEVLFDAYRRVALSRSRVLGPRIIALLTAELVIEGRVATDAEDTIVSAAENLADDELIAFAEFIRREQAKISGAAGKVGEELRIKWCEEQIDSNWKEIVPTGPLDLDECLGRWAGKMKSYGIIKEEIQERQFDYEADSERHIDEPGTVREITWWISVSAKYFKLVDLISRARGNSEDARIGST
jgi:hypothetical protein